MPGAESCRLRVRLVPPRASASCNCDPRYWCPRGLCDLYLGLAWAGERNSTHTSRFEPHGVAVSCTGTAIRGNSPASADEEGEDQRPDDSGELLRVSKVQGLPVQRRSVLGLCREIDALLRKRLRRCH